MQKNLRAAQALLSDEKVSRHIYYIPSGLGYVGIYQPLLPVLVTLFQDLQAGVLFCLQFDK